MLTLFAAEQRPGRDFLGLATRLLGLYHRDSKEERVLDAMLPSIRR